MDDDLSEYQRKFDEALRLIDQSSNDPETEPFKSRYAATELFCAIKEDLTSKLGKQTSSESGDRLKSAIALTNYYASLNYSETEEYSEVCS